MRSIDKCQHTAYLGGHITGGRTRHHGCECERPIQPAPPSVPGPSFSVTPTPRSAPPDFRPAPLRFPLRSLSARHLHALLRGPGKYRKFRNPQIKQVVSLMVFSLLTFY